MFNVRSGAMFLTIVVAGCSADDSDTTIITTAITSPMGNWTVSSPTQPGDEDIGESEGGGPGSGDETTSGGGGSGSSSSGDETTGGGDTSTGFEMGTSTGGDTGGTTGGEAVCDPSLLLAMTPTCVFGVEIASAAWADQRCADTFGDGWIWLEHHQQGGWYVEGKWIDDNGMGERGWVYVDDQPSACYETNYGVTWVRGAFPDQPCRADCWSTIGLEGPEYQPQDGQKCNSYVGDTPCEYCRPLICARP